MANQIAIEVSVFRYVLAGLVIKILFGAGLGYFSYLTENEPPNLSTLATIISVAVGMLWYSKSVNRPMIRKEITKFAIGTAIADLVFSISWFLLMIWITGSPLSLEGIDNAIFDGKGSISNDEVQIALVAGMGIGFVITAILAAFFAWLMTRSLPKFADGSESR